MKNFKFVILLILFFVFTGSSFGQIKIKWNDVHVSGENLVVKVFAQNLGRGFEFWNQYGYYGNKNIANFYLEYDLLRENRRIKVLPQAVLIETIFGTVVEMDTPMHYFPSTGSSNGQYWEIMFNLPTDVSNIVLTIFGKQKSIDDSEEAIVLKEMLKKEFLAKAKDKHWAYEYMRYKYEDWFNLKKKINSALSGEKKLHKRKPITGTITYHVNPYGDNSFKCEMTDLKYNELVTKLLEGFKLNRVYQYGWYVNSTAKFKISIVKGGNGSPKVEVDGVFDSEDIITEELNSTEKEEIVQTSDTNEEKISLTEKNVIVDEKSNREKNIRTVQGSLSSYCDAIISNENENKDLICECFVENTTGEIINEQLGSDYPFDILMKEWLNKCKNRDYLNEPNLFFNFDLDKFYIAKVNLNVRSDANTNSDIVHVLKKGDSITVTSPTIAKYMEIHEINGKKVKSYWLYFEVKHTETEIIGGWIFRGGLKQFFKDY